MSAPLSLAGRLGRVCERLNGFRMVRPPQALNPTRAAFVIRDGRGDTYRVEITRHA